MGRSGPFARLLRSSCEARDKGTLAGRRYLDLQREARRTGRPTDELIQLYALECFLDRLVHSEFAEKFVLKGGVLLAALEARRPTRDIDLAARALENSVDEVLGVVRKVAGILLDDGLEFDSAGATADVIREEDSYSGVRVTLGGQLSRAVIRLHGVHHSRGFAIALDRVRALADPVLVAECPDKTWNPGRCEWE